MTMSEKEKPTHSMPGGSQVENNESDNGVVNDSFGKTDPADTTGIGEDEQPCEPGEKSGRSTPSNRESKDH